MMRTKPETYQRLDAGIALGAHSDAARPWIRFRRAGVIGLCALASSALMLVGSSSALAASGAIASSAASTKHCASLSRSLGAIRVSGLSCRSADAVVRAAASGKNRPRGFSCHSTGAGAVRKVSCHKGRLAIFYTATSGVAQSPPGSGKSTTPQPTQPTQPAAPVVPVAPASPSSPHYGLAITSAALSPEFGASEQDVKASISVTDESSQVIDDFLDLYLLRPGQSCATSLQGYVAQYQAGETYGLRNEEPVDFLLTTPQGDATSATFAYESPAWRHEVLAPYPTMCALMFRMPGGLGLASAQDSAIG
jgi:hypothetical protein